MSPRQRAMFYGVTAAVLAAIVWRLFSVPVFLHRIRGGHAPSQSSLRSVGTRALPLIYREIHELGDREQGEYRADLVYVISGIRHDVIAKRIGSPLLWEVEATLLQPDGPMVDALKVAMVREPNRTSRERIALWAGELDFNTKVAFFCGAFPEVAADSTQTMVSLVDGPVRNATLAFEPMKRPPRSDPSFPFRDLPADEIARIQREMRAQLACAVPQLVTAFTTAAPTWTDSFEPLWATQIATMLGKLRPLPDAERTKLLAVIPKMRSGFLLSQLIEPLAPDLALPTPTPFREAMLKAYRDTKETGVRFAIEQWVEAHGSDATLSREALFCATFADAPADHRWSLVGLSSPKAPEIAPCVQAAILKAYEAIAVAHADDDVPPPWMRQAEALLRAKRTPDIIAWATALRPRVKSSRIVARLDALIAP